MKKTIQLWLAIFVALVALSVLSDCGKRPSWADDDEVDKSSSMQVMERVETVLYGQPLNGGLIERLNSVEKELFGRGLPGSISERHSAILNFLEVGTADQPSMLFKLGVAEWIVGHGPQSQRPAIKRVEILETELDGAMQSGKPLAMRVERLIVSLVADPVTSQVVILPKATVLKVRFLQELSPAFTKRGESVNVALVDDLFVNKVLVAPKGSPIQTYVRSVRQPQRFGVPSNIELEFRALVPLGPERPPLTTGAASQKAIERSKKLKETGLIGISGGVGASVGGAMLLGPIGLLGGALVKGDALKIPEGSFSFVETSGDVRISGYPIPASLQADPNETIRESVAPSSGSGRDTIELPAEQKLK